MRKRTGWRIYISQKVEFWLGFILKGKKWYVDFLRKHYKYIHRESFKN